MEILGKLGINGKILLAQAVNFFLLMYVLKRFLYKPLLDIMKKREARIKEGLANAEKVQAKLASLEEQTQKTIASANQKANKILETAHREGESHKAYLTREAVNEIARLRDEAKTELKLEKEKLSREVRAEAAELIINATRKLIKAKITTQDKKMLISETKEKLQSAEVG